jgi:hypothetical protein
LNHNLSSRRKRGGDPIARFWSKVDQSGGRLACWLWLGSTCHGYGQVHLAGRSQRAHRVAWELLRGSIPTGLVLDHLCETKRCVNPLHLEPVTLALNSSRGAGYLLMPHDLNLPACKAEAACVLTLILRRMGGVDEFVPETPCACTACGSERASC